jgi:hypothetical protein
MYPNLMFYAAADFIQKRLYRYSTFCWDKFYVPIQWLEIIIIPFDYSTLEPKDS